MRGRGTDWPYAQGYRSLFIRRCNPTVKDFLYAATAAACSLTTVYHRQYGGAMQLAPKFGRAGSLRIAEALAGNGVTGRLASPADACRADG
jgi:hypothetical protein